MVEEISGPQKTFTKDTVFQLLHGIKNVHRSKLCTVTYTLEKKVFAVTSFESLWVSSFQTELKTL